MSRRSIAPRSVSALLACLGAAAAAFPADSPPRPWSASCLECPGPDLWEADATRPPTHHECARFLAGLPVRGSRLTALQSHADWEAHARHFGARWAEFERARFLPMRAWASANLQGTIEPGHVLFYPFSGPDVLNAVALFPEASTLLLVGLEPVGVPLDPTTLSPPQVWTGLINLRRSTDLLLRISFFRTKDMLIDLHRTAFRGVTPILHLFLALAGFEISGVECFRLEHDGRMRPDQGGEGSDPGAIPGVTVRFRKPGVRGERRVHYVRADCSDIGMRARPELGVWLEGFGGGATYLKAASYLLHEEEFSRMRDLLLRHSRCIVQDDSGIPFRWFTPPHWERRLFGSYASPIPLFGGHLQRDMLAAYRQPGSAAPLPFGTGYRYRPGDSNLLVAVRRLDADCPIEVRRALPATAW